MLAFPIDEVWDAITSPERLAEWWLPFEADVTVESRDVPHDSIVEEIIAGLCSQARLIEAAKPAGSPP